MVQFPPAAFGRQRRLGGGTPQLPALQGRVPARSSPQGWHPRCVKNCDGQVQLRAALDVAARTLSISQEVFIVSKPLRLSDLSPARQALVRLCQAINHGSIEDLEVRHSEPVFDPWPVTLRDVKLDSDEGPRPELALADFVVSNEVYRLMRLLDDMKCGTIRRVEVHAGVPRRIVLESQVTANGNLGPRGGGRAPNATTQP